MAKVMTGEKRFDLFHGFVISRDTIDGLQSIIIMSFAQVKQFSACAYGKYPLVEIMLIAYLTRNAQITSKVVCFSRLLKCLRSLYGKQCGPRSDCSYSGSTLFASILNSSVMLGNYLQQMTSADDIFRCIFFLVL